MPNGQNLQCFASDRPTHLFPVWYPSITSISSFESLKSNILIFDSIRSFRTDFGMGTVPISYYNKIEND